MTQDPGPDSQDPEPRIKKSGSKSQNEEPRPRTWICDQGLGVILHTVWTFPARIIFVKCKYLLHINTDVYTDIFTKVFFTRNKL